MVVVPLLWAATVGAAGAADIPGAIRSGDCKAVGAAINAGIDRKDPDAYYYAGYLYDNTGCVDDDPARAARLYRRAADLGSADGATALGVLYGLGRGVARDYAEAFHWYRVAASRSESAAETPVDARSAIVAGYAMTVVRAAVAKVRYPRQMERDGIGSTLDAVFSPATGVVTFRNVKVAAAAIGSNVSRSRPFTDAVVEAYAAAVAALPGVEGALATDAVTTPWRFSMVRNDTDRATTLGGVTVGFTTRGEP